MVPPKKKTKSNSRYNNEKCIQYNRGYCAIFEDCPNEHPDKVCPDANCFEQKCNFRHPNPCKFGKRCVFNFKKICLYSHLTLSNDDDKKMKALKNKRQV